MEDNFLASMMRSKEVSLVEKFKLYKNNKKDESGKPHSEAKIALLEEVKNHDFSQHGTTKQIIDFCIELRRTYEWFTEQVLTAAKPFMKFETLTLSQLRESIHDCNYTPYFVDDICNGINWKRKKKETIYELAKQADSESFWKYLINYQILTEDDLDMLLWGQKTTVPKVSKSSITFTLGFSEGGFKVPMTEYEPRKAMDLRCSFTFERAVYESGVSVAYKRKMLLWENNRNTIADGVKNIFSMKAATEKDVLELTLQYGPCEPTYASTYKNVFEMGLSYLKKPSNILKIARLMKTATGWETVMDRMKLYKQDGSKVLRIAKISGHPKIWEAFFFVNKNQATVPHEELMRIGGKFKELALWAVLLKHIDYSKVSIDWVFKFVKICGLEVVPHMQQIVKKKYKSTEACNCMEAMSGGFDWKSVSYEKRIEALHLHYISYWQDPIIKSLEKIEMKDFLSLNEKFRGVSEKLQSKVLSKV